MAIYPMTRPPTPVSVDLPPKLDAGKRLFSRSVAGPGGRATSLSRAQGDVPPPRRRDEAARESPGPPLRGGAAAPPAPACRACAILTAIDWGCSFAM